MQCTRNLINIIRSLGILTIINNFLLSDFPESVSVMGLAFSDSGFKRFGLTVNFRLIGL